MTAGLLALLIVMVAPFIPNAPVTMKCVKQWDDPGFNGTCLIICLSTSGMHRILLALHLYSDILEN